MKKRYIIGLGFFLLSIAFFLFSTSAKSGSFRSSTTYIQLSSDMIPTYIEKINADNRLILLQHVSGQTQDQLYIESHYPYVRGVLIVQIPKITDVTFDTPLQFQVSWHNIDDNTFLKEHPQKELLGDHQIIGHLGICLTNSAFIPDFDLVCFGASSEECKEHTEEFIKAICQCFSE